MIRKALVTAAAVYAGLFGLVGSQDSTAAEPVQGDPASCSWGMEYKRALDRFDEDPSAWSVSTGPLVIGETVVWGAAGDGAAEVSTDVDCWAVKSVVAHEHFHLQQYRLYGSLAAADAHYGSAERTELVADCASMLSGSSHIPYVHMMKGCSLDDIEEAKKLIS